MKRGARSGQGSWLGGGGSSRGGALGAWQLLGDFPRTASRLQGAGGALQEPDLEGKRHPLSSQARHRWNRFGRKLGVCFLYQPLATQKQGEPFCKYVFTIVCVHTPQCPHGGQRTAAGVHSPVLSFHSVGPREQTQVLRLGSKHLTL